MYCVRVSLWTVKIQYSLRKTKEKGAVGIISVYFLDPHTPATQLFVSCYLIAVEPLDVLWLAGREARHAGEVDGAAQVHEHVRSAQDLSHRVCTVRGNKWDFQIKA